MDFTSESPASIEVCLKELVLVGFLLLLQIPENNQLKERKGLFWLTGLVVSLHDPTTLDCGSTVLHSRNV